MSHRGCDSAESVTNFAPAVLPLTNIFSMRICDRVVLIFALLTILAGAVVARAQSEADVRNLIKETQARGYWTDMATGLTWAGKDNDKNVTWKEAGKYCRDLRLAGYADWRLPSIDELQGIYDGSGYAAPSPRGVEWVLAGRPKGGILVTGGDPWSSTKAMDDRGHPSGYAYYFDFSHGWKSWDPYGYHGGKRALCVRTGAVNVGGREQQK